MLPVVSTSQCADQGKQASRVFRPYHLPLPATSVCSLNLAPLGTLLLTSRPPTPPPCSVCGEERGAPSKADRAVVLARLLDFPRLLDACALYGPAAAAAPGGPLSTQLAQLVAGALQLLPRLAAQAAQAAPLVAQNLGQVAEACLGAAGKAARDPAMLQSLQGEPSCARGVGPRKPAAARVQGQRARLMAEHACNPHAWPLVPCAASTARRCFPAPISFASLHAAPADGIAYLRDTCLTLAALLQAHPPAAALLLQQGPGLIEALGAVHDQLLPAVHRLARSAGGGGSQPAALLLALRQACHVELACERLAQLLLLHGYIQPPEGAVGAGSSSAGSSRAGAAGGSAVDRGEALLQALMLLGHQEEEAGARGAPGGADGGPSLAEALAQRLGLGGSVQAALQTDALSLDDAQADYVAALLGVSSLEEAPGPPLDGGSGSGGKRTGSAAGAAGAGVSGSQASGLDLAQLKSKIQQARLRGVVWKNMPLARHRAACFAHSLAAGARCIAPAPPAQPPLCPASCLASTAPASHPRLPHVSSPFPHLSGR